MFEELIARVRRKEAELGFELTRASDPYRLSRLLSKYAEDFTHFVDEASQLVEELEDKENG